ncbi:MAG: hypothetical protein ABSG90_00655 [Dehalococcoidia bacterium]
MKITRLTFCLMISISLLLPGLAGCVNQTPIEGAIITDNVTSSGQPELAVDNFTPDVNNIYCSVKLSNVSASSTVKAEWYVAKSEEAGLTNSLIASESLAASSPYVVFSFIRADKLLPRGDYEVKLYYNNKYQKSALFTIAGSAGPAAAVSEATMCSAIDLLTNKPIDQINTFPNDVGKIFCSFKVSGAGVNTVLKAHWAYVGGEIPALAGKTINDSSTTAEGRDYISFSIAVPPGKTFPNGEYDLKLLVEDKEVSDLPFKVVPPSSIPGPFFASMSTFAVSGSDNNTIALTAQFPADTPQVNLLVRAYNLPAGTDLDIQWSIVKSTDLTVIDQVVKEDKQQFQGSGEIVSSLISKSKPFITGDYQVKLLADSQEIGTVPFKVQ